jgi:hypothetical protein
MSRNLCLPVVGGDTAAVDDYTEQDKSDDSNDFDQAQYEFDLTVAPNTNNIDEDDNDEEYGNPDAHIVFRRNIPVGVGCPELDCNTSSSQFERQDDEPTQGVIPAHSKAPGRVNEADRVVVERAVDRVPGAQISRTSSPSRSTVRHPILVAQSKGAMEQLTL